ncbi:MAG: 4-hydroxythreonine-4-phosphate dehydrogenase PdxA [Rhodocyclaceae bacterium]
MRTDARAEKRALPVIAITSGEPAGIGPELCLLLAKQNFPARLVVLSDRQLLAERASVIGASGDLRDYVPTGIPSAEPGVEVLHLPLLTRALPGKLQPGNAPYVLALLDRALDGCRSGEFAAMVTAPVHKAVINQSGTAFSGHTEYLAEHTGTPLVVMMLAGETGQGPLRVALATTHLPLRAVADAITPELLEAILRILHADMARKFGIAAPRILVAGLNPHAGEDGYLGREEIEVMAPVLARLRAEGMNLIGPLPADTLFTPPQLARGDCVLAMYHDQGLAALKYATFGKGINVTLGLPIIRTSVDHGTALELAGTGRADPGSLFEAVHQAISMVEASRRAA